MIRIQQLLKEITEDAATTKQAKALGLKSIGFGRWTDDSGRVTHVSQGGKLVRFKHGVKRAPKVDRGSNKTSGNPSLTGTEKTGVPTNQSTADTSNSSTNKAKKHDSPFAFTKPRKNYDGSGSGMFSPEKSRARHAAHLAAHPELAAKGKSNPERDEKIHSIISKVNDKVDAASGDLVPHYDKDMHIDDFAKLTGLTRKQIEAYNTLTANHPDAPAFELIDTDTVYINDPGYLDPISHDSEEAAAMSAAFRKRDNDDAEIAADSNRRNQDDEADAIYFDDDDDDITEDAETSKQARALGLTSIGWGRWADKSGEMTHTTKDGKLVPVPRAEKPKKTTEPIGTIGTNLSGDEYYKWIKRGGHLARSKQVGTQNAATDGGVAGALTKTWDDPEGENKRKIITAVWNKVTSAIKDGETTTADQMSKRTGLSPKAIQYALDRAQTNNPAEAGFSDAGDGKYSVHHGDVKFDRFKDDGADATTKVVTKVNDKLADFVDNHPENLRGKTYTSDELSKLTGVPAKDLRVYGKNDNGDGTGFYYDEKTDSFNADPEYGEGS